MIGAVARLVDELDLSTRESDILPWAGPVPFFGRLGEAEVATVGINPSNREFLAPDGVELQGSHQRLPTLRSLGLTDWGEASGADVRAVAQGCVKYFDGNPYRQWFDVLERLLNHCGYSYYREPRAAHIDLVAFATATKWGELPAATRQLLVAQGRRTLGELIRDSRVSVLILNGRSVVDAFMESAEVPLVASNMPGWTLPRTRGGGVAGVRYSGTIRSLGSVPFDRAVTIIGFNHNLQSSFGVTRAVVDRIAQEVGETVEQARLGAA